MNWYDESVMELEKDRLYSRKDLILKLQEKKEVSDNSCNWIIGRLVSCGSLHKSGRDRYSLPQSSHKDRFTPVYSDKASDIKEVIEKSFPYVAFTVFETSLMNEFLNHLIAQNTVFIQIEKGSSIFVFRFLRELGYVNIMYKPDRKTFSLYWSKDCIVITDLISESPPGTEKHSVTLEKMLVDMVSDKLISTTYSVSELESFIAQAEEKYSLDKVKLFRYARRRGRECEMRKYLRGD